MIERLISAIGLLAMIAIAWMFSNNRRKVNLRVVIGGVALQLALAFLVLKTDTGQSFFRSVQDLVVSVVSYSDAGARFLFGDGFAEHFFAFKVLPTIIFVSSLSSTLFYLGVMQKVVESLAWLMHRVMKVSGVDALTAAANIFVGQTEAPLFVAPYIKTMTSSEILTMMTGGMATVAGGVLAAYVGFGISAGHLLAASLMSAPAAILIAKIMVPETETSATMGEVKLRVQVEELNIFEAACKGASEGLKLSLNVGAMLIAFLAILAMINGGLAYFGNICGFHLTLEEIFGVLFQPLAMIMGVPWQDSAAIGQLLGTKIVLNEFVAYMQLADLVRPSADSAAAMLQPRSVTIATYALCGFANFSSVAIQIGGIGNLEPSRKKDFAALGIRALIGGSLAAFMTACIAGIFI